ncbi:MAG: hypothetical protein EOP49_22840, partial [Sphingobacteriales bacterium]
TKDTIIEILNLPNAITVTQTAKTDISCISATGSVTIAGGGGTTYTYSRDGLAPQNSGVFTGLTVGNHTFRVSDVSGCTKDTIIEILNVAGAITVTQTAKTNISCTSAAGSVTIAGGGGTIYTYSRDGLAPQNSGVFTGLTAGNHTFRVIDASTCFKDTVINITATANNLTITQILKVDATCLPGSTGAITLAGGGGTPPYSYSVDGGAPQLTGIFLGLSVGAHNFRVTDLSGCIKDTAITISQLLNNVTVTQISKTNIGCAGGNTGAVTISGGGGLAPYSYQVDGGADQSTGVFAGLALGTHIFRVTDNSGCIKDTVIAITQLANTVLANIVSTTDVACAGGNTGAVTVSGSGGTPAYTYSIDNLNFQVSGTFAGLAAGPHVITVRDGNGCTATVNVSIGQVDNTVIPSVVSRIDVSCLGGNTGSVTVIGTGGTAPYEYKIGSGAYQPTGLFANLAAGDYVVTVKDAGGCTRDITVTIVQLTNTVTGSIASKTDVSCAGGNTGSITVAPSGGAAPYSYQIGSGLFQLSPVFNNLAVGDYTITVRDAAGCVNTVSTNIVQLANTITVTPVSKTDVSCAGVTNGAVTIAGAGGTAPYEYKIGNGVYQASGTFSGLAAGGYTITVKDAAGCTLDYGVVIAQLASTVTATLVSQTDVPCSGGNIGAATVAGGGGTAPYQYRLDNGA